MAALIITSGNDKPGQELNSAGQHQGPDNPGLMRQDQKQGDQDEKEGGDGAIISLASLLADDGHFPYNDQIFSNFVKT